MSIYVLKLIIYLVFAGILPSISLAFYLSGDRDHIDLLDRLIIALLLSPLVLVFVSFLEEVLGIPQNWYVITGNLSILALINIFLLARYYRWQIFPIFNLSWGKLVFIALLVLIIIYRVLPTQAIQTPLLHDPVAHSEWLKQLNQTHFTTRENWYPQGIEYYLNYFATYFDVSYPKIILTWTNVFSALFPVGFFYMGLLLVRNAGKRYLLYPMVLFALAAVSRIPTDFYFLAGKNSLIFLFSSTPIILYAIYVSRSKLEFLVSAVLLCAALIVHYPTGFFLLAAFFIMNLLKLLSLSKWKINVDTRIPRNALAGIAAMAVFGVILALWVIPIYRAYPPQNDRSIEVYIDQLQKSGVIRYITDHFYQQQVELLGTFAVLLFITAVVVFLFAGSSGEQSRFTGYLLVSFLVLYLVQLILLLLPDKVQGIFYNLEIIYFFVLVLVSVSAWFINYVFTRIGLLASAPVYALSMIVLAVLVVYLGNHQYRLFLEKQDALNLTFDADLDAFRYINDDIDDDSKFLIQLDKGMNVVLGFDSGIWIPSFTDKQVEVDFTEFSKPKSYEVFNLYQQIVQDSKNEAAITKLHCDYDIGYVFFGSKPPQEALKEKLEGSQYFSRIYDYGASIYKIEAPDCG